jgi:hypothetical protein
MNHDKILAVDAQSKMVPPYCKSLIRMFVVLATFP